MRVLNIAFVVCSVFLCGCMTFEKGDDTNILAGSSGAAIASTSSTAPRVSGSSGSSKMPVRSAPQAAESIGVIFEWNSASRPLNGSIAARGSFGLTANGINAAAMASEIAGSGGAIKVENGILIIGAGPGAVSGGTKAAVHTGGVFNITEGLYRLTIDHRDIVPGGSFLMRITINNNTSSQAESVLGARSVIGHFPTVEALVNGAGSRGSSIVITSEPNRLVLTLAPALLYADNDGKGSLANAFFGFVCPGTSSITITGMKFERLE